MSPDKSTPAKPSAATTAEAIGRNDLRQLIKYYAAWLILIWAAMAVYFFVPYYRNFLSTDAKIALRDLAIIYTLAAPAAYYLAAKRRPIGPSRAYIALRTLNRLGHEYKLYLQNLVTKAFYPAPKMSREERTNLLFMVVKLFFLPMMLTFLFSNLSGVQHGIDSINAHSFSFSLSSYNTLVYPLLLSILLLIDTAYFTFGYAVEAKVLNNKVVSVDPTFLGWAAALLCYPPFNGVATNYLGWHANDYAIFGSSSLTGLLYLSVLGLMFIYVAATVALGAKSSNLTNRGIVTRWPYSFIRHPAYISKNLAWWVTLIPILSPAAAFSMAAWSFIYFLRAITEERHLMMVDNGYKDYASRVRWRFIPGVI